ncbi:MAG: oxidoreductase [Stygiobacter sp. RIFOXYC12_FULL_38_8]|nr:MAG: oxidoreductase [Stygiobacter sp. GWC2_38_9]OGU82053.1 MAG: oxidoreductase [Stygiobacter sp. RIFOXYA12_FULL_38_9]OGV09201.1 MAG: oxidoreductase [Stygiobacter sp. RIFOXYB2_FULL_37_11]OGV10152.1 MAG: oxidoreductase [Stygiobacter sp. RIFOXYA2_FULL_38_8]OGV13842.1 MAG: oxidoreductase [Stygiobacter sp. RIFOXYC2_FULL_38_25]OGV27447.1 MAG: oxidoreductase [Stygiobacter sp. RIFOXYC12_FULL_38_8]OGV80226.1 MAG: oxidoreductase [Stygiobacter sp. GWF2_38_21]OGV87112.1 MAG: oxidoreductase [Melioriba
MKLKNKIALVTGGARDIGRAVSLTLAKEGASVVINYYDNEEQAKETLQMINDIGGKAIIVQGDMTKWDSVQNLSAKAVEAYGKIDILVNVAGGLMGRHLITEMQEEFWDLVMNLNLKSVYYVCKAVIPNMNDGGAIVNFTSQAARDGGGFGAIAYATAKGGVLTFTRGLAKELGPKRIRVNAVSPGMINTTFHDQFTKPEIREKVAASTPLGREGNAQEVADLVLFLASDSSSFINGESVEINGGIFFS